MAILISHERNDHVSAIAARVFYEYDESMWIGTSSKISKAFKETFYDEKFGQAIVKLKREDVVPLTDQLIHANIKYFYKINTALYKGSFPIFKFRSIHWIESKTLKDPSRMIVSRKVYEKIFRSMFEKEVRNMFPKYKLTTSFFNSIVELAQLHRDESLPF